MPSPEVKTDQWLAAAKHRRTVYGLAGTSPVPDSRIEDIVKEVISFSPSSYNTQPGRITLVLGQKHKELWDIIISTAEPILKAAGPGVWDTMGPTLQAFRNAYGSVLFWVLGQSIRDAQAQHKSIAHMFEQFGEHQSAMAQILVWTALELEGFGANLQHFASIPPVEAAMRKFAGVSDDYSLKANLNFGELAQPHPEVPKKLPINETLTVLK